MTKRILSILITLTMIMMSVPVNAQKITETADEPVIETVNESEAEELPEEEQTIAEEDILQDEIQPAEQETAELAESVVESGKCGDDLTWTLDSDGVLTISGIGDMWDYNNDSPFCSRNDIITVVIEKGVTSIGGHAFNNCSSIISINIPEGVTSIGNGAFRYCSSLISIIIPADVTSIGNGAFYNCDSLTSINIPEGVTSIGDYAFLGCGGLDGVYITDLAKWCGIDFGNEHSNPIYYAYCLYLNGERVTNITIPDGVTSIKKYAFYGGGLTSIILPDSVISIGDYAFSQCGNLKSINIPDSVRVIEDKLFIYCYNLESIIIPKGILGITANAFYSCSNLKDVYFKGTEEEWNSIPVSSGNDALKKAEIHFNYNGSEEVFCGADVSGVVDSTGRLIISGTGAMADYASEESPFYGRNDINRITIAKGVTSVGSRAFENCSVLNSVTIPDTVTHIGSEAFSGCSSLTDISIPVSVTSIDGGAFSECTKLKEVIVPNSVTSIGSNTFYNCKSLNTVTVPASVTSIGVDAFGGCSNIKKVYYTGSKEDWEKIDIDESNTYLTAAKIYFILKTTTTKETVGDFYLLNISVEGDYEEIQVVVAGYSSDGRMIYSDCVDLEDMRAIFVKDERLAYFKTFVVSPKLKPLSIAEKTDI